MSWKLETCLSSGSREGCTRIRQRWRPSWRWFEDLKKLVDSKQLKPVLRSQYLRTYFQIPFDKTVQIKMDTNITMMKENPDDGPACMTLGRWFRDPSLPLHRTDVTRFPHAVLDLKLSLTRNQETPAWVQELVSSGDLEEMNNFSKQLHGITTLFPDLVQAVPYWVDRDSVRASMMMSAPVRRDGIASNARDVSVPAIKPEESLDDRRWRCAGRPQGGADGTWSGAVHRRRRPDPKTIRHAEVHRVVGSASHR